MDISEREKKAAVLGALTRAAYQRGLRRGELVGGMLGIAGSLLGMLLWNLFG